ncbi:DNA translocase FtsK [Saccharibacillus sp. CPCC 101409]|uniref:FtsK/SpoIIIE family DNA translocase n=1 Tax=Saccharibacillus sp. CPCC 101409 TaxID=3058041 RepID=UPI002673C353|nr:DNA translocase FtsK [Saccharibacillus sp. CPCC 101409]MDO3410643.1 DNA translocase FtsK [Saccharibacillus sp. CPCC 101409]
MASALKYEIYGIVLITLSVIGLSGQAVIGRLLSAGFGLLLGKAYALIPLLGIYAGLYLMIRRGLPYGWSPRKSGLLLLGIALVLILSIGEMQNHPQLSGQISASGILTAAQSDLHRGLVMPDGPMSETTPFLRPIGGGYLGALMLSLLFLMVGLTGAKLAAGVLLAIGVMLAAQMSYVELMSLLRRKAGTAVRDAGARMKEERRAAEQRRLEAEEEAEARAQEKEEAAERKRAALPQGDDGEDEPRERGAGLLGRRRKAAAAPVEALEPPEERAEERFKVTGVYRVPSELRGRGGEEAPAAGEAAAGESQRGESAASPAAAEPQRPGPIIRDFFEHIRSERGREAGAAASASASAAPSDDGDDFEDAAAPAFAPDGGLAAANAGGALNAGAVLTGSAAGTEVLPEGDPSIPAAAGELLEVREGETIKPPPKPYKLPPLGLLAMPKEDDNASANQADYMQTARKLETTLESFGVRARVLEVVRGPAVTRYEIQPDVGVKVSRVVGLTDDIALALAAKDIRMEAPIPGKSAIGIEVPNNEVSMVTMREVMDTSVFADAASKLTVAFGRDISGQTIVGNLARMPHLLVAGATGSGKSVCINGIIASILYKAKPDEVKFLMVDPKMVELNVYNGIPHLLAPVVTDPRRASLALKKIVVEMEKRYELFSKSSTRNIEGYNTLMKDNPSAILPYIVVIVDELADLMMVAAGDVEDAIARLAQMARAAGIHLIIATQRPSVDVITGVIKANIPSRIAFGVSSQVDSRTILDMGGAEKLLGRGDMLFMPMGASKPVRVQGAFLSDNEVEEIVAYCSGQAEAEYDNSIVPEVEESGSEPEEIVDELYDQAVQIVVEAKQASVSLLQRRMRVGYTRAARLVDSMEARGIVGPYEGSKPREVLISIEQLQASRAANS